MRFLAASLLVVCVVVPARGAAQTVLLERFGVCWLTSVPLREHWVSPMFEHEMRYGELFAETERASQEFRDVVPARAPEWPPMNRLLHVQDHGVRRRGGAQAHSQDVPLQRRRYPRRAVDALRGAAPVPTAPPMAVAAPAAASVQPTTARQDTGDIEGDYWSPHRRQQGGR